MKDVDEVLRDAGSRWRAAQPDPREVDAALFTSTARTWGGWATRLAVASVAGVVVLAFGIVQWRAGVGIGAPPSASARPSAAMTTPSRGPVLAAGDRVRATGVVVARANGAVSFCLPAVVDLSGEAGVVCSPVSVGIEGLDLSALPGWSPDAEGGSSGRVTVDRDLDGYRDPGRSGGRRSCGTIETPTCRRVPTPGDSLADLRTGRRNGTHPFGFRNRVRARSLQRLLGGVAGR